MVKIFHDVLINQAFLLIIIIDMLTADRMAGNEENTDMMKDQLAVTVAFPDNSQQEEERVISETMEATEVLFSCEDTWAAPQPEHVTVEEQFQASVTNPEAHLESENYEKKMEMWLSMQKNSADSALVDAFPGEQRETAVEIVPPVPAQVTDYSEEVTSVSGGGPIFSTEEQAVLSETSVSETTKVVETDQEACDTDTWTTNSGAPCESSVPGEAAMSAYSHLDS